MHLAEWRRGWQNTGERELLELLDANWDPFEPRLRGGDPGFRSTARERLFDLGRRLHEGAGRVDVQVFLNDLRQTRWPERSGGWWMNRDRTVAEKVVDWYHSATGE